MDTHERVCPEEHLGRATRLRADGLEDHLRRQEGVAEEWSRRSLSLVQAEGGVGGVLDVISEVSLAHVVRDVDRGRDLREQVRSEEQKKAASD
jgi:hypothetical protein